MRRMSSMACFGLRGPINKVKPSFNVHLRKKEYIEKINLIVTAYLVSNPIMAEIIGIDSVCEAPV